MGVMDLRSKRQKLELRARTLAGIRAFFTDQGYLEVETPVRVRPPALEEHIDAEVSGDHWLRTSPELHMKRMVCAGYEKIFQIGPCFRRGEKGTLHLPEYTMLEWYRSGADCLDLIPETVSLLKQLAESGTGGDVDFSAEPLVYSVRDLFSELAGWDPVEMFDADRFDVDLVEKVEPFLKWENVPVVLKDFPAERAALARLNPKDPRTAERWEMYVGGMEIANAYTELTDPAEQRTRFEKCAEYRRSRGQEVYPLDEDFLCALADGMPDCAGIALGIDRLLMCLTGADRIDQVVAFSQDNSSIR